MADQAKPPYAILGGYELRRELGRGGMGVVYEAHDPVLERTVALKILPRKLAADASYAARFLNEARAAARLNHPNIVTIHAVGEANGHQFIAMECVRGVVMSALIRTGRRMPVPEALQLIRQVADALAAAHAQGIIHRDIKPQNIMVDAANRVKVLDFGLAKLLESTTGLTNAGASLGTPRYMAPEQVQGKKADARSDIYSLGLVLYELLAGRPAFEGDSPMAVMYQIVHEPFPSLTDPPLALPPPVAALVEKMVAKDPESRYDSVSHLLQDVDALQAGGRLRHASIAAAVAVEQRPSPMIVDDDLRSEIVGQTVTPAPPPHQSMWPVVPSKLRVSWKRMGIGFAVLGVVLLSAMTLPPLIRAISAFVSGNDRSWISLFDGTTLDGWRDSPTSPEKGTWSVADGAITSTSRHTNLESIGKWRNFELELEYRVEPASNGGVFPRGRIEVQISDETLSGSYTTPTNVRNGAIYRFRAPDVEASNPAGSWNRLQIRFVDELLTVRMNGQLIHDAVDVSAATRADYVTGRLTDPGPVLLQVWEGLVWYRNIRIRSLDADLDGLPRPPQARTVQFPLDRSLGELGVRDWGDCCDFAGAYEPLGNAQGAVQVPPGKELGLSLVPSTPFLDFSFLNDLGENDLQGIGAESSRNREHGGKGHDWQDYYPTAGRVVISDFEAVSRMKCLTAIQFSDYLLPEDAFAVLSRCSVLREVTLNYSRLDRIDFAPLAKLSSLKVLDLSRTNVGDEQLTSIGELSALLRLDLDFDPVSDVGVAHLVDLRNLTQLSLTGTNVTDSSLRDVIKHFNKLEKLSLNGTVITDQGLTHLEGLIQLKELSLAGTNVSEAGKARIQRALPSCKM